ncbi:FGGY-family carbohydrate kinase, partial [Clavibacter michiganensis]|uniref:FGGY-family carbohydrate kinase n=1 Tax=Clavibacter michiganensis TaxID=28447 RepID=UPI00292FFB4C
HTTAADDGNARLNSRPDPRSHRAGRCPRYLAVDDTPDTHSVLVDHAVCGIGTGTTLTTRAEEDYRALLEATAFGTRNIVETFAASGVPVTEFIVSCGLLKNAFLMLSYSDILRLPISFFTTSPLPSLV